MPAATFLPTGPRLTTQPPVMYSQQWSPVPSTTASAIEFRTAKRSPARPLTKRRPPVAPYRHVFPTMEADSALGGQAVQVSTRQYTGSTCDGVEEEDGL